MSRWRAFALSCVVANLIATQVFAGNDDASHQKGVRDKILIPEGNCLNYNSRSAGKVLPHW
jgi:hypothetical protein